MPRSPVRRVHEEILPGRVERMRRNLGLRVLCSGPFEEDYNARVRPASRQWLQPGYVPTHLAEFVQLRLQAWPVDAVRMEIFGFRERKNLELIRHVDSMCFGQTIGPHRRQGGEVDPSSRT